jgi:hypothetical protein
MPPTREEIGGAATSGTNGGRGVQIELFVQAGQQLSVGFAVDLAVFAGLIAAV